MARCQNPQKDNNRNLLYSKNTGPVDASTPPISFHVFPLNKDDKEAVKRVIKFPHATMGLKQTYYINIYIYDDRVQPCRTGRRPQSRCQGYPHN